MKDKDIERAYKRSIKVEEEYRNKKMCFICHDKTKKVVELKPYPTCKGCNNYRIKIEELICCKWV